MIQALGDSHAWFSFTGIPGVEAHHIGPVTMYRAGRLDDALVADAVAALPLAPGDVLVLCFGEIDARCHVHKYLGADFDLRMERLVNRFLDRALTFDARGARVGVLSITPPTTFARSYNASLPVLGTDAERVCYVQYLNRLLASGCRSRGLFFLDVYNHYADKMGMLKLPLADAYVHILDTAGVRKVMLEMGLLS